MIGARVAKWGARGARDDWRGRFVLSFGDSAHTPRGDVWWRLARVVVFLVTGVAHGCRRVCFLTPYRGWFGRGRIVVWCERVYSMRYTVKTRWEGAREETPKTFELRLGVPYRTGLRT